MPFVALRDTNELEKKLLPSLACELREIVIELAAARQFGHFLTMKQLLLLQGGTATTMRRRIAHLMALGYVVKHAHQSDGRVDHFDVSDEVWDQMLKVLSSLNQIHKNIRSRLDDAGEGEEGWSP